MEIIGILVFIVMMVVSVASKSRKKPNRPPSGTQPPQYPPPQYPPPQYAPPPQYRRPSQSESARAPQSAPASRLRPAYVQQMDMNMTQAAAEHAWQEQGSFVCAGLTDEISSGIADAPILAVKANEQAKSEGYLAVQSLHAGKVPLDELRRAMILGEVLRRPRPGVVPVMRGR